MNALRFLCLCLAFNATIAWADDGPATLSGYPYTDLTYDALLDGNWTGVLAVDPVGFAIHDHAIHVSGCPPIPYDVVRDQIRTDPYPPIPDQPHSESYRDIAIMPRFPVRCTALPLNVVRFLFTKDDQCSAVVTVYRTRFDLDGDKTSTNIAIRIHNGINESCRAGAKPGPGPQP
jgi:hypothetical protein